MSAQNTALTSPNVSSTSEGLPRASRSAVLTARFPSQASAQVNQIAELLAQAPAAQSADPTKDMAPILLHAAEMNVNPFSGVMDTPEVRRGLFDHLVKPTEYWERLIQVEIPAPYIFKGAKRTVALVHQTRKFVSGRPGYEGLTCITVNMKIEEITEYFTHKIPCNYDGPFDVERTADGTLVRDGVDVGICALSAALDRLQVEEHFKFADKLFKQVKAKYPDKDIHITGHSLGGATAAYVGCRNEAASVTTFNRGGHFLKSDINNKGCTSQVTNYKTRSDPLSTASYAIPNQKLIVLKGEGNFHNAHAMHNFNVV